MKSVLILKYILTGAFGLAGLMKVIGVKPLRDQFEEFKLSRASMVQIGALEMLGAFGLQADNLLQMPPIQVAAAAVGLALLMAAAAYYHAKALHPFTQSLPAIALGLASGFVAVWYLQWLV